MPTPAPFVVTLPPDGELRDAIEEALAPYATVHRAPPSMNLDEIKLIVEVVHQATGVLADLGTVAGVLLALHQARQAAGRPSTIQLSRPGDPEAPPNLTTATEDEVRRWLERSGRGG
jgi:hypothetical protein